MLINGDEMWIHNGEYMVIILNHLPSGNFNIAIENGPVEIVTVPIKNADLMWFVHRFLYVYPIYSWFMPIYFVCVPVFDTLW